MNRAQAQTIPYNHDFEATDTAFHLYPTGDTLAWKTNPSGGVGGSRCLVSEYVTNSAGANADKYYTSLRLPLVAGNTYRFSFKTRVQYAHRRKALLAIHTTAERSGNTLLHDFDTLTATEGYQTYSHDFGVETTGSYHLIYYGESVSAPKNCPWYTDDLAVTLVNTPPTSCTLSSPANNSYYNPGQSVALVALPTDAQNNLSKVEWYSGGTKVAEDATPDAFGYYTASFVPQNGGAQTITAKAIDSYGAALTSNSRNITVRYMPQVALTNLADHSDYYPGSQPVSATATDPDGTVQRVVFYVNGDSVGVDSSAPYQCAVPLVYDENQAEQTLTAKATDNDGLEGTQTFTLFVKPGPCSLTTPNGQLRQALCSGDSLMLVAEGGNNAQTLQWYHRPDATSSWEALAGADFFRLQAKAAGHYQAVWTYANAAVCTTAVDTVGVFGVRATDAFTMDGQPTSSYATPFDGVDPVSFSWSNIDSCWATTCDTVAFSNLTYPTIVTATDANNCVATDTVFVRNSIASDKDAISPLEFVSDSPTAYIELLQNREIAFQKFIEESKNMAENDKSLFPSKTITIPIVFGVISNPETTAVGVGGTKDNEIKDFIVGPANDFLHLNEQVAELNNFYKANTITYNGVAYQVQFCLATRNSLGQTLLNPGVMILENATKSYYPDRIYVTGRPETEIDQTVCGFANPSTSTADGKLNKCGWFDRMDLLKDFDHRNYLRVIVCDFASNAGYGTTPSSTLGGFSETILQKYDGIMININAFKGWPVAGNRGKALIHETGHWLNLEHTFHNFCDAYTAEMNGTNYLVAPGDPANGSALWDFVKDTPPQSQSLPKYNNIFDYSPYHCPDPPVPAAVYSTHEVNIQNMMDYGSDQARVLYTPDQKERLIYTLGFYRPGLFTFENLTKAGVSCVSAYSNFTLSETVICRGTTNPSITVTPLEYTSNSDLTYTWAISPSTGITMNPPTTDLTSVPRTITFGSGVVNTEVSITLTVGDNAPLPEYPNTKKVFVGGDCEPCLEPTKQSLFFGDYAGLHQGENTQTPYPAINAYNSTPSGNRIKTSNGVVSYSDDNGSILFYAAGSKIWNRQHKKLSATLSSDEASSQFGVAAKAPDYTPADPVYYLFTVPANNGNTGLRWHKIRVSRLSGINAATPSLTGSVFNQPVVAPTSAYPHNSTDNAVLVSEKITLVHKANQRDFYLVVQGPSNSSYGDKFYVYEVTSSGIQFVANYPAVHTADHGVLKISVAGDKLLSTYTNTLNAQTGYASGNFARVFSFDNTTGEIGAATAVNRELIETTVSATGATQLSSFGGSFSDDGSNVYININNPNVTVGTAVKTPSGIYKFKLSNAVVSGTTDKLAGVRIQGIPAGLSKSVNLMLAANKSILISCPVAGIFEEFGSATLGGKNLGMIYFPNNYSYPGLTWDGPPLTTSESQTIRSRTGLPNFSDALKTGYKIGNPADLGVNPKSCCGNVVRTMNAACTETGKKYWYEFAIDNIYGDYPGLTISTCGTDFAVNTSINIKKSADDTWIPLVSGQFSAPSCTSGFGSNVVMADLNNTSSTFNTAKKPYEFRVELEAQTPSTATGDFRLEVTVEEDYGNADPPVSCCRIAMEGNEDQPSLHRLPKPKDWSMALVPNPAKSKVAVRVDGLEPGAWLTISDALGRKVAGLQITEAAELDIQALPKGIYRVSASDHHHTLTQNLAVE